MVQKIYTTLLHLTVIINYVLFLAYKESIKDELLELFPNRNLFGGSWKFLTHWNVILQLVYFCLAFLNDVFGTESRTKETSSRLQKCRDYLFSTLAFPIGIFVPTIFWILFNIDRNLVFPPVFDKIFPAITNHMMHTTPLPSQILELFFVYHVYPRKMSGIPAIVTFCLAYVGWIFYIAYAGGIWVYPVFEVLNQWQRILFVIVLSMFGTTLYLIGEYCHTWVWKDSKNIHGQATFKQNELFHKQGVKNGKKCQ